MPTPATVATVSASPSSARKTPRGRTYRAYTFNEREDIGVTYDDGTLTGKKWTRQWTIKRKDGKPLIVGIIYDVFDVGRGPEYEFVQVTTPPNELIAKITGRMLLLSDDDLDLCLGALRAPLEDVKEPIKTYEFNPDEWEISVEDPSTKPTRPRKPKSKTPNRPDPQGDLL